LESNMGLEAIKTEFWYTHSIRLIAMNWHQYDIFIYIQYILYFFIIYYQLLLIDMNYHVLPVHKLTAFHRRCFRKWSKSLRSRIVYVSCNPDSLVEDDEDINTGRSIAGFRHGYN
jgi:hypothetical protein